MNINIAFAITAILSAGLINKAFPETVKVPSLFDSGPAEMAKIKLEPNQIVSLMLLESVMDISSSAVLANSCDAMEGNYAIEVTANGEINKPETNVVKISSANHSEPIILKAAIEDSVPFIGQNFNILQTKNGKLRETLITDYANIASVNSDLTLLSMHSHMNIPGQNNNKTPFYNILLKHYYEDKEIDSENKYLLGWGSASLSQSGFPVNKYWARFKAMGINGQLKRLIFQEKRLTGASTCHIVIDSSVGPKQEAENNKKTLNTKGMLTIAKVDPHKGRDILFDI